MSDALTDEERIEAWKSSYNPSLDGWAIVNEDFTFRSVNQQFCQILGVTPAELIGNKFQDITHPSVKRLDELNSQLVIQGQSDGYSIKKSYLFEDGREVHVILLVVRVPKGHGKFQFFVSRILEDASKEASELPTPSPSASMSTIDFLIKYGKIVVTIGTLIGATVATVLTNL